MPYYTGNAIYNYINENNLDYFFCTKDSWTLIYGDSDSNPKLLAFVSEVEDLSAVISVLEINQAKYAKKIAENLSLPFIFIRFQKKSDKLFVILRGKKVIINYQKLKDIFTKFGVSNSGTPSKPVNQYSSSPYHDWQRNNLGKITVSDLDLVKFEQDEVVEIIELKRSKISLEKWRPYEDDFPNFQLIINSILNSNKNINFRIYYNLFTNDGSGGRVEDISLIKVFTLSKGDNNVLDIIPNGTFSPEELLK